ncbi:MAG: hypothetical protein ACP5PT_07205 [Brevinematia bacterium]
MRKFCFFLLIVYSLVLGCTGRNVKFESQNIEEKVKVSKLKFMVENFKLDSRYHTYFVNSLKNNFLSKSSFSVVENDEDWFLRISFSNFNELISKSRSNVVVRLDFISKVDMVNTNGEFIFSNSFFSYTLVSNVSPEIFIDEFSKNTFLENLYYKFFDEVSMNLVYYVSKGWKENYGYYSSQDGIIQAIFGGSTNESTKKTNKRNIPVIGGE